jgi:hypothetical protein
MRLVDVEHPFYRPAWRRYALAGACFAWAGLEYWWDNPGWAVFFAAIGLYLAWVLIFTWTDQA